MSNTKKHKLKGKYNKLQKKIRPFETALIDRLVDQGLDPMSVIRAVHSLTNKHWDSFSHEDRIAIFRGMSKNPSWWNRQFNRVPKRRQDRDMLKKTYIDDEQDLVFTDDNKPNLYYW